MEEEIAFENGRISDFQGLVTLTLTFDRVILDTVIQSSTSTYIPNFIEIKETFCGQTDVRVGGRTFETHFIRSTRRSRPNNHNYGPVSTPTKSLTLIFKKTLEINSAEVQTSEPNLFHFAT